ncbi:Peptidase S1 domain-containing protein [Trichostrongylus colubriformis]|uniref:Peptidase S1 domain-containing protein n=1 Tax=Trichostrongylus colubriformis TaxID=6319 RepID=A0AAN8FCZ0_TRICO
MRAVALYSHILLTLFIETSQMLYDAERCGLQGVRLRRSQPKVGDTGSKKAVRDGDDYSPEYEVESDDTIEDENDPMQHTVMGGESVSMGELPWTVLIHLFNGTADDKSRFQVTCSGTLVTRRHIMTAAHCFQRSGDDICKMTDMINLDTVVKYGEIMVGGVCQMMNETLTCTKKDVGQIFKIKRAQYDNYFKAGCDNTEDIALLELEKEIPDGISHICLPHLHNIDNLDIWSKKYLAAGWGADPSKNFDSTPRLYKINLGERLTNDECLKKVSSKGMDTFCTLDTVDKNVCVGDSGSGIIAEYRDKYYLFGLLSTGTSCGDILKKKPELLSAEIHTDIAFYTAAIDSFIDMKVENRESAWKKNNPIHSELNFNELERI